jgi:hypothetical protein
MDSQAGLDDDEDFFGRYDAEQASQSLSTLELDAEPPALSADQLAHSARFRKPVAWFLGAMTLLALTALALRSSEPAFVAASTPRAPREFVAHYGAAIPAATPVANVAAYEPVSWGTFSGARSQCLLDASADTAWLSIPRTEPASIEGSPFRMSHPSSSRGRRPAHTSSLSVHGAANARLAPAVATPKTAVPPFSSVARFPDARP